MILQSDLDKWFECHEPSGAHLDSFQRIQESAKILAEIILEVTLPNDDQAAAIRKIREAVMTIKDALVCRLERRPPDFTGLDVEEELKKIQLIKDAYGDLFNENKPEAIDETD